MRVSVIGAARRRNGIGEYIAKYLHRKGAEVVSVLGTTEETSNRASAGLMHYGIQARPYTSFERMVEEEKPEAVAIASPAPTHYGYLEKAVELGLHVFCEKPFVWSGESPEKLSGEILERARNRGAKVAMNSQWPFTIRYYEDLCGKVGTKGQTSFFIRLSPPIVGDWMIPESVPHALSILHAVLGEREIHGLGFRLDGPDSLEIRFAYGQGDNCCEVTVLLIVQREQPRVFEFGFNGRVARRVVDLPDYSIYLEHEGRKLGIPDPLELSVRDFIDSVKKDKEPLIGSAHIIHNMRLLAQLYREFVEFQKKELWKN